MVEVNDKDAIAAGIDLEKPDAGAVGIQAGRLGVAERRRQTPRLGLQFSRRRLETLSGLDAAFNARELDAEGMGARRLGRRGSRFEVDPDHSATRVSEDSRQGGHSVFFGCTKYRICRDICHFRSHLAACDDPERLPGDATTQPRIVRPHRRLVSWDRPEAGRKANSADLVADEGGCGGCLVFIRLRISLLNSLTFVLRWRMWRMWRIIRPPTLV